MSKKYLIYLDILGFKNLASEISEKTGFDVNYVRQNLLINPLREAIKNIDTDAVAKGISEVEHSEGSDNFILAINDLSAVFNVIAKLTNIKIPIKDFLHIPLEVAVGVKDVPIEKGLELISYDSVIDFLKEDIITPFKSYNKKQGHKICDSFIVASRDFFEELQLLDKKIVHKINFNGKFVYSIDKKDVQRKLKVHYFLQHIKHYSERYERINELYVEPNEFEEIASTLALHRIVFLSGSPEYGKTYTAAKLLWEYFERDYIPIWYKGEELEEREKVRTLLEEVENIIKPKHVVYFEDPFGKTEYEKRETLEREIGHIVNIVNKTEDAYVIITSREEVFKRFKNESASKVNLEKFEKKLNIQKPSYSDKKREEILLKLAEAKDCEWYKEEDLIEFIIDNLDTKLHTPLSIRDFVFSTTKTRSEDEIYEALENHSEEAAQNFAQEIKKMSDEKILFLCFPFVGLFPIPYLRTIYKEVSKELDLKDPLEFDQVLRWLNGDKVECDKYIEFSHPSYHEAVRFLITDEGVPTRINRNILSRLLIKLSLSHKKSIVNQVLEFINQYIEYLDEDTVSVLLEEIAKAIKSLDVVALSELVDEHYDLLPKKAKYTLLSAATKNGDFNYYCENIIANLKKEFNEIPVAHGVTILNNLSKDCLKKSELMPLIISTFKSIPDKSKVQLMLNMSKDGDEDTAISIAGLLFNHIEAFNSTELFRLFTNLTQYPSDRVLGLLECKLKKHFFDIPIRLSCDLLIELLNLNFGVEVLDHVIHNFKKIPDEIRNEFILELASNENGTDAVSCLIEAYPDKLSNEARKNLRYWGYSI